jgi:hypothetical protein
MRMSFSLEENDYHDAILKSLDVSYELSVVSLRVEVYGENKSQERSRVDIRFEKVKSFNVISNFIDVSNGSSFGNINYITRSDSGYVYIYLSNGVLEIISEEVQIYREDKAAEL